MTPQERYKRLKHHLSEENPLLDEVIELYRSVDAIGHKSGLLDEAQSYTEQISWWPLISILGTFSAGKSTFINNYLGVPVQQSGNQAIDDKFTVLAYGNSESVVTLPGMALDADPRFPFYNISDEINRVEKGEGDRVNLYLQLKTLQSDALKGKILIDSPGFDADSQRDTILRMTSHIIDLSDLVLIFFDARHPEPGAMRDTLEHLVGTAMRHNDADKILYILNQIDTTAKEDNLEDVIGAWQRSLSQQGLVGGNFFAIYNENAAVPMEDPARAERLLRKKDADWKSITERMDKVGIERAYRIIRSLENVAKTLHHERMPQLQGRLHKWSSRVLVADTLMAVLLLALLLWSELQWGWIGSAWNAPIGWGIVGVSVAALFYGHFWLKKRIADAMARKLQPTDADLARALRKQTRWWRPLLLARSRKWGTRDKMRLEALVEQARQTVQRLNDTFLKPQHP